MSSYAILLRMGWDGVEIDSMIDVTSAIVGEEAIAVAKVCDRIDGVDKASKALVKSHNDVCQAVAHMEIRTRFDSACEGPFVIHCEHEVDRDELQKYLRANPEYVKRLRKKGRI
jgi:hypothetical protein